MARLTKIITRNGDRGETGLIGGDRVGKDHPRIEVGGAVDELNSAIGLARSFAAGDPRGAMGELVDPLLEAVQHQLFRLGAELATPAAVAPPGMPRLTAAEIKELEDRTTHLNQQLGSLAEFILPGGCPAGAALHLARSICRRAERQCVRLGRTESLGPHVIPYLNRLGDALFVLARQLNRQANHPESLWRK